ncbi:S9 family peptidase [Streptomyces sp. NPDC050504]|uniref:S9 family peptidase n=1 Tax=Streptomyces sp. NPDC050504 TaxID=3365618 RepID=UPI0037887B72
MPETPSGPTAFHDLSTFVAQRRVTRLALSPDGGRLVAAVQQLNAEGTAYVSGLWELDPEGEHEPRRLTRSAKGESAPAFAPDGTLLFLSGRENTDPAAEPDEKDPGATLWALPGRGEAERVARHPGGIHGFAVARDSGALAYTGALLPGAADADAHAKLTEARAKAKVTAILFESGPTRYWDHDLGPAENHTFVRPAATDATADATAVDAGGQGPVGQADAVLSPDGTRVAHTRRVVGRVPGESRDAVVVADAATGEELRVVERPGHEYSAPLFTSDGTGLLCSRLLRETYETPYDVTLVRVDLATGEETDLLPDFDNWPREAAVAPRADDATIWFAADEQGHAPAFRLDPDGTVTRLTASGAYGSLVPAPDGRTLYALRNAPDAPPAPVRLDQAAADQTPVPLKAPGDVGPLPGTLVEVHATGDDGFALRGWLALPDGASADDPAPLLVFAHGGPQSSWNEWTWRWNPWPFVARGYAALLPDPALSTGYGQAMHERGWGQWGGRPYDDLMALTDAAQARPEVDPRAAGLAGGSYGGYMANRVATRTDRFQGIVSHAGIWDTRTFQADTDAPSFFRRIFGDPIERPERYEENSPFLGRAEIRTPMLLVHGAKDYRVPVGQALGQFNDLQELGAQVKFLYFPDENHWILKPNHSALWYETVLNFFDERVRGEQWRRPGLL